MSPGDSAGRRDLIEERLKDVVVAPVDEQNIDRRVTKCFCGVEPAETAADDDDARTRGVPSQLSDYMKRLPMPAPAMPMKPTIDHDDPHDHPSRSRRR